MTTYYLSHSFRQTKSTIAEKLLWLPRIGLYSLPFFISRETMGKNNVLTATSTKKSTWIIWNRFAFSNVANHGNLQSVQRRFPFEMVIWQSILTAERDDIPNSRLKVKRWFPNSGFLRLKMSRNQVSQPKILTQKHQSTDVFCVLSQGWKETWSSSTERKWSERSDLI